MLRPHLHRLAVTSALMAGFIGTGYVFGVTPAPEISRSSAAAIEYTIERQETTSAPVTETADGAAPAKAARPDGLSWPFFSFGRKPAGGPW